MIAARRLKVAALGLAVAASVLAAGQPALAASEIAIIVNKDPITTFAIQERMAFVKLRRVKGDPRQAATDELIDEALKKQETRRLNIRVPDAAVDQAYLKFASDNKLTPDQLGQVLGHAGFSQRGFKDYIRVQMGWGQAVQASMRNNAGKLSEEDVVQRMLQQGGNKPSTTEYQLQQVIFVIPPAKRAALKASRMTEANGMRNRFSGCENNYTIAKGLRDVTIRDLGRVTQPELPALWTDPISRLGKGGVTPVLETEKGLEFIAVCSSRSVSDDKVAAMVFQSEDLQKSSKDGPDAKLLAKLKEKAAIIRR
ncbi:SurA N-terminal domain-containing protein [Aureimonas leprariae]|uniref:Peptidylprolyl isomerase n=1 Tax=Plantimonas leprariae TaxID=2615207 RepID=A0A7V7PQS6_9HYPH|nr:SurA N-terminal domain-containing protein [Aureimonas leprariae]KAB0680670.1 peptidylprolyl isomerase [Aureimonas leprariae]